MQRIFPHNGYPHNDGSLTKNIRLKICQKTCIIEQRDAGGTWKRHSSFPHPIELNHAVRLRRIYDLSDEAIAKITRS